MAISQSSNNNNLPIFDIIDVPFKIISNENENIELVEFHSPLKRGRPPIYKDPKVKKKVGRPRKQEGELSSNYKKKLVDRDEYEKLKEMEKKYIIMKDTINNLVTN